MNEITFTIKLNDADYDELETAGRVMGMSVPEVINFVLKPEECIKTIVNDLRQERRRIAVNPLLQAVMNRMSKKK